MRLSELLETGARTTMHGPLKGDTRITGLTADSRSVEPGMLFAALPGTNADGRAWTADALARGAAAVLAPADTPLADDTGAPRPLLTDPEPRRRLALMAARFHQHQPDTVAAVTGTDGKSSTVGFARQMWQMLGHTAASLGTLGCDGPSCPQADSGGARPDRESMTTPDPVTLHRLLAELAHEGVDHLAMEASSHGLAQFRLDGVRLKAAAFTNLTHEHLDYHGDFAGYRAAKLRLFGEVLDPAGTAVVNADAAESAAVMDAADRRGARLFTVGTAGRTVHLAERHPTATGQALTLDVQGVRFHTHLPLVGGFQATNALLALGLVLACGDDRQAAVATLPRLAGVRGRLERVATAASGAPVFIDYAHTPGALETVLDAVRPHAGRRLVVVLGAGGDRDAGKRPVMGRVAARYAGRVIVTDDNPRGEDPAAIRAAVLEGCPGGEAEGDREAAIARALDGLGPDDVLLIAGKGHETGQVRGDTALPFDDAEAARRLAADRGGGAP